MGGQRLRSCGFRVQAFNSVSSQLGIELLPAPKLKTFSSRLLCGCGGVIQEPMMNEPPPFKGLNTRIPIIIPIKGRGFINQGSGLIQEPMILREDRRT